MSRKTLPVTLLDLSASNGLAPIDRRRRVAGIIDQVKVKPSPEGPETAAPGALVRVSELVGGALAWQGYSDDAGQYRAGGLVDGRAYLITGHDLSGTYESVGAGPLAAMPVLARPDVRVTVGVPCALDLRLLGGDLHPLDAAAWTDVHLPAGCTLAGDMLHGDWPTGAIAAYGATFNVTRGAITRSQRLNIELVLLPLQIKADKQLQSLLGKDAAIPTVTFTATGGEGPYIFDTTGTLPSGLSLLDNEDGTATLSGTPDEVGAYSFAVRATDARAATRSAPLVVAVKDGTSYLAYRISVTANNGGVYAIFGGCQLRRSLGADPIDVSGATYFSTGSSGGDQWGPRKAFDGTPSSAAGSDSWASNATTTGTVGFILPAPALEPIQITMRSSGQSTHTNSAPKNFTIQASNDTTTGTDGTWVTLWSETNQTGWGVAESRVFNR